MSINKSTIIDDLTYVSSIASETPGFDHLRIFGTCKMTSEGQTVLAGEWRAETENGQPLLLTNSPVRFFKYTDEECEWFFNWMQDQLINPDTHLSALLLPKCVLVMEPSDDFPFRAELSLSGMSVDDLAPLFIGGSSFMSMGSLGRQFVIYVKPHVSSFGKLKTEEYTGNAPRILKSADLTGIPSVFDPDPVTHSCYQATGSYTGRPVSAEAIKEFNSSLKTVASLTDSGDNDIFSAVNEHVNQPNLVVAETTPDHVVGGIAEDMTMQDLVASRAKMNLIGAELQKRIHELGKEHFRNNPVEVEESVAPSDVSIDHQPTTAEALGEQAATVNDVVGQAYGETVKDTAAVESMFPDSTEQDTK